MVCIKSINIFQTAFIVGLVIALTAIPLWMLMAIPGLLFGHGVNFTEMLLILVGFPLFYLVMGFVFTALFCFIYNHVAERFGGIEIELEGTNTEVRS